LRPACDTEQTMRPVIINGFSTPVMDHRYMLCIRNQIFLIQKSYTAGFEDNAIHDSFVRNKFPQHVGSLGIRSFPECYKISKGTNVITVIYNCVSEVNLSCLASRVAGTGALFEYNLLTIHNTMFYMATFLLAKHVTATTAF